jgi:adenine-specific DNA-methyltransferase
MYRAFLAIRFFPFAKPASLMRTLIKQTTTGTNDLIVDFFGGSGTTAQAVLQQNALDDGSRRFVLVQVAESTDRGDFGTIADIAKERIRRAGLRVTTANPLFSGDTGFRVLKIDASNMQDVYYSPDAVAQADLLGQVDNIRPDRSAEDLLFQVLVDWGLDLALPIAEETIEDKKVFFVDKNALAACFDVGVTDEMVKAIAQRKPLRAVFRDSSYGTDSVKINVEQIFKLLSPETEVRSI